MKKAMISLFVSLITVLSLALSACGSVGNGTYYPDKNEMSHNLTTNGYQTYSTNILVGEGMGMFLSATKGDDYIKFYWLDRADDCEFYYRVLEEDNPDCNVLVKIENDEKYGNLVYCGTTNAVNAAGIKVVKVDVNVKV